MYILNVTSQYRIPVCNKVKTVSLTRFSLGFPAYLEWIPHDNEPLTRYKDDQPASYSVHHVKNVSVKLTETLGNKENKICIHMLRGHLNIYPLNTDRSSNYRFILCNATVFRIIIFFRILVSHFSLILYFQTGV